VLIAAGASANSQGECPAGARAPLDVPFHAKWRALAWKITSALFQPCSARGVHGPDGSYYVTSPYHPTTQAHLFKATVNYARDQMTIPVSELIDSAAFDDDEGRLKFSHHPDGFVQFSGTGVLSGKDDAGNIRSMGVMSWPLEAPARGPAFAVAMIGIEKFEQLQTLKGDRCTFTHREVCSVPDPVLFVLEGHYFPPLWRRFVRTSHKGEPIITVVHQTRASLSLKVLLPPVTAKFQGFIGIELYTYPLEEPDEAGFFISGPTGNIRVNEHGEKLGDGIFCCFPRSFETKRSLAFGNPDPEPL
jgi:hypothetical protein